MDAQARSDIDEKVCRANSMAVLDCSTARSDRE
jgi:hypothetical protein